MSPNDERDSWGFTEAEHRELRALLVRYPDEAADLVRSLHEDGGIAPMPEDPGFMGWLAREVPDAAASTRSFPAGAIQRALLEALRRLG